MEGGARFGMVGLGTMGRNLLLNVAEHGFQVAGLDLDAAKASALEAAGAAFGAKGFTEAELFVSALARPRTIMILVPAGPAVDSVISSLAPLLEPDDFLIDGGNSYFRDTDRRCGEVSAKGFGFLGLGVSGGEEGARHGPSMMAGGTEASYRHVEPVLQAVAARVNGEPCVGLLGPKSAGHYVKMVHNGIEYGLMQLIAESYDLMKRGLGMTNSEIADAFSSWNAGPLGGFLLELAAIVLRTPNDLGAGDLVDFVKDQAKQKGTGKWTSQEAMDLGVPIPTIDAAVSARELSSLRDERAVAHARIGEYPESASVSEREKTLQDLRASYACAAIATYAQGFSVLSTASREHEYKFKLADCASVWRAGCIIRSNLLEHIRSAFQREPDLPSLLVAPEFSEQLNSRTPLRSVCMTAISRRIPMPAMQASLAYIDGYSTARLPANLIQAQRDSFGAHTYERIDREGSFHSNWSAK